MAEFRQKQGRWSSSRFALEEAAELRRRCLEPTNLVKLAQAEIQAKQWNEARQSIRKLQKTEWPSRFNTIEADIRRLQEELPK